MLPEQQTLQLDAQNPQLSVGGPPGQNNAIPNYDIPLLFNNQPSGAITLHATLERYNADTIDPQSIVARGGLSYLVHFTKQTIFAGNVPFALNTPQFFSPGITLAQNGHSWQLQQSKYTSGTGGTSLPEQPILTFISAPSGLTYRSATPPHGGNAPAYSLVPAPNQNSVNMPTSTNIDLQNTDVTLQGNTVTASPEVAFRSLTPLQGISYFDGAYTAYNGAIYTPQTTGIFNDKLLAVEFANPLNWLPENTYAAPPTVLRYDAHGHTTAPINLLPTTNPAGFTLQPPLALTTLAADERIRGSHCISVIRVRIAGDVSPDEAGWLHVTHVAQLIHQRTGLQVLITSGSSPKPTLVYIPGMKQGEDGAIQSVAPLGWAEERWIAIGAGIIYLQQLGETRSLLLGAVLLVCLGYLAVTLSSLASTQRSQFAILNALGWEPWQPAGLFLVQALLLALVGSIVGIGIALLIVAGIGVESAWFIVAWTIPIILALALLSALYPLWQLWRVEPAEVLREGSSIAASSRRTLPIGAWIGSHLPPVLGMALRNLARSRLRSLIALGSLFLSAGLLTVMLAGLLAFRQSLQGTLLGDFVLLQTAVPQLVGAIVAILLTFLSVADLLLLQVRERQREIGLLQAVGWRSRIVQGLFVQEGLLLALAGTIPGVLLALGILLAQHQATGSVPAPVIGAGAIVLMLLVATVATLPAIRALRHLPLGDILRAE